MALARILANKRGTLQKGGNFSPTYLHPSLGEIDERVQLLNRLGATRTSCTSQIISNEAMLIIAGVVPLKKLGRGAALE